MRGNPAIARQLARNVQRVIGVNFFMPPSLKMSASPCACTACITDPAPRKRHALKNAWVKTWKKPAAKNPTPTAANMNPSWLTVEYARIFFISRCTTAMEAASKAVRVPVTAMMDIATSDVMKSGESRQHRYTPAVTMVAAWMRAETGVGPAIASGSQT